jgi:preprotein translocase subunit YajC
MSPTTSPTTTQASVAAAADAGKVVTVKGTFIKMDPIAKTVTVKPEGGTEETYSVITGVTAITLDNKSVEWDALASAGSATGTITASGNTATSIVAETPPWWAKIFNQSPLMLMIIPLGLFLLLSVRNKKKQERAQQEKLGSIKRGDRIQTIGGIIGNVVQTDEARVLVKVDESNNTKIWFARSAVGRVLGEEKSSDAKTTK